MNGDPKTVAETLFALYICHQPRMAHGSGTDTRMADEDTRAADETGVRRTASMKKRIVLVLVLAAAVAVGGYVFMGARRDSGSQLQFSGTVETREIQVGSKVGGRVTAVLVEEGQLGKAGSAISALRCG